MLTPFLCVAQSGKTIDGREITPAQIDQMAATYDPKKYGARVNVEHFVSAIPDGIFRCVGDVKSVKAADGPDGTRVLLAQIDGTPEAVRLAETRQKVYFSIEVFPNFAGTNQAYLGGLALTDSPASLGTEMLTFAIKSDKATDRLKTSLFSIPLESVIEMDEPPKESGPSLLSKVKDLMSGKGKTDDARFAQVETAVTAIAVEVAALKTATPSADAFAATDAHKALVDKVEKLSADMANLTAKLSNTPNTPERPKANGAATDSNKTDC